MNEFEASIPQTHFSYLLIDFSMWNVGHPRFTIDEFRIYDGVALHTENFVLPTAENYIQQMLEQEGQSALGYSVNTERTLTNNRKPINPYIAFSGADGCYGEVQLETLAGKSTFTIEAKWSVARMPEQIFADVQGNEKGYNLLVEPTNAQAGAVRIWHDGAEYALTT